MSTKTKIIDALKTISITIGLQLIGLAQGLVFIKLTDEMDEILGLSKILSMEDYFLLTIVPIACATVAPSFCYILLPFANSKNTGNSDGLEEKEQANHTQGKSKKNKKANHMQGKSKKNKKANHMQGKRKNKK